MKLIRVTQLEKFRRYITEHSDYDTEQSVIDGITGAFKGNEYTFIGTAFHRIVEGDYSGIEKIDNGRIFNIDGNKVFYDLAQCNTAVNYAKSMPNAFHELREYQEMQGVMITGCADIINGFTIRDIKTKYSPIKDTDYTDSCQWHFYLDLFGADTFMFDLFEFVGYKKDKHGLDVRGLEIRPYSPPIVCYRYAGMEQDNNYLIREFIEWAKFRNVFDKLPDYNINGNELH
ncbi:MAG: hypothetical protein RR319_08465 [Bacteroides sp.]